MEAPDFFVENLLDLPNGDDMLNDAFFPTNNIAANNSTDSSNANAVDSCNSSISGADNIYPAGGDYDGRCFPDAQFSGELCVPYDAELEWLSNFVEESFSSEDLHKLHFIPAPSSNPPAHHNQQQHYHPHQTDTSRQPNSIYTPVTLVPGKARSKLSRVAPSDWSTRLLMVAPPATATTTSSSDTTFPAAHHLHNPKKSASKRRDASVSADASNGEMRRCLHCAAEKTPQWRTGPMGPKTLCNACGVRYKSGRLVPEYRPAASPTFVSTKHSNSHRKVMELRRQKDMHRHVGHQGHQQQVITASPVGVFGLGGGSIGGADDYLIHHHVGPDYRQLI